LNIFNHHFSKVLLGHLLKTSLQPQFIGVTSCLDPKLSDSLLFLFLGHVVEFILLITTTVAYEPLEAVLVGLLSALECSSSFEDLLVVIELVATTTFVLLIVDLVIG
jgi:hypothetical protein